MLYYTVIITKPDGTVDIREKLNHIEAMQCINDTITTYNFTKPISNNTFHNILSRPHLLPERVKWLINTGKMDVRKTNQNKIT